MLKVILIDDEKWIVKSLKSSIDWHGLGYEIIGEAFNGLEGYDKIKSLLPDIVFTDIRMPGMDGIELMRRINELNLDVQFVITSGYKEFEFAKKAIQYGALDYCLKPFDEMEMTGILERFSKRKSDLKAMQQTELLSLLQEGDVHSREHLRMLLRKMGFEWDEQAGATIVVVIGEGELHLLPGINQLSLRTGRSKRVLFFEGNQTTALEASLAVNFPPDVQGIGIGAWVSDVTSIIQAIEAADEAAYHFFITGQHGFWGGVSPESHTDKLKEMLLKLSRTQNGEYIKAVVAEIEALINEKRFTIRNALFFYHAALFSVYHLEEEWLMTYEELVHKFGNVKRMNDSVASLLAGHYTQSSPSTGGYSRNSTYLKIVDYIDAHYKEEVSLQSISEKLDLNLSYISQLFRKESSNTFLQYLTKKRMACASELLKSTTMSIQEIAEHVGYSDYFHFAKLFKKSTGQTATQCRERSGIDNQ
ncbi:response regulator transcription factor [Cohnella silvisoli]|uniref:Response regulator n=1 Tax=Cohnella silvisoli TaxID=2873699 RepID=A0ABV1L424_9BACL|nr:response regulator [Cohnella silvisoli]MCD9026121.1 response regulator [Cohnella silvisoli]